MSESADGLILLSSRVQLLNDRERLWGWRMLTIRGTLHLVEIGTERAVVFAEDYVDSSWARPLDEVQYLGEPSENRSTRRGRAHAIRVSFAGERKIVFFLGETAAELSSTQAQLARSQLTGDGTVGSLWASVTYLRGTGERLANAVAAKQDWISVLPRLAFAEGTPSKKAPASKDAAPDINRASTKKVAAKSTARKGAAAMAPAKMAAKKVPPKGLAATKDKAAKPAVKKPVPARPTSKKAGATKAPAKSLAARKATGKKQATDH